MWPMPKRAKMMLETRNPVVGEFMRAFLPVACRFVSKNTILAAFYGHGFGCDPCKSAGDFAFPLLTSRLCRGFCAEMRLARESQEQRSQFFEGRARATRRSNQGRALQLGPAVVMAPGSDAAQFPRRPQIQPQRRKARTACGQRTESRRRSTRQQLGQRIASTEKDFRQP